MEIRNGNSIVPGLGRDWSMQTSVGDTAVYSS
ncbi:hypothetical protein FOQG_14819 [Fusarium oxysporum f. sp. raphani 54005]|uniref:Uncharacterized protein n=2 Tax=Fusarium oxysporum TaxID=5507 RepID=X0BFX5_FUSOX|nr:hypothetical protein FOVG_11326 [Fusarium oxysporum f. sp. pisi HDV247]EXK80686.1 hypothetical protein FOQG_14819 [Fusarium oxysporum f. sp. raphani 54005]